MIEVCYAAKIYIWLNDLPSADSLYAAVTELQLRVLHLTRPVDFAVTHVFLKYVFHLSIILTVFWLIRLTVESVFPIGVTHEMHSSSGVTRVVGKSGAPVPSEVMNCGSNGEIKSSLNTATPPVNVKSLSAVSAFANPILLALSEVG